MRPSERRDIRRLHAMKVEPVRGQKFASLVRRHGGTPIGPTPVLQGLEPNDPLAVLLTNYLLWESTLPLAKEALERISRVVVDVNELRVMLERELADTIGERYPFVEERARRLRATLNDVFRRQHRTSLDHLRNASRKDQRGYVEGLAEIPPFVAGRTLSVAFELPSPTVDDSMVEALFQQGIVEATATTLDVSQWIARHHRLEELGKVNAALEAIEREALTAAGKNPTKLRSAYLARHAEFRAAAEADRAREEDERRQKAAAVERAAEERRLAEIAKAEDRVRQKREAEEARIKARAAREEARIAAIAARERAKAEREAERIRRDAARARQAELKRRAAEREAARRAAAEARKRARAQIAARRAAERERLRRARRSALERKRAMARKLLLARRAVAERKKALRERIRLAKRAAIIRRKERDKRAMVRKRLAIAKKARGSAKSGRTAKSRSGARAGGASRAGRARSGAPARRSRVQGGGTSRAGAGKSRPRRVGQSTTSKRR